MQQSEQKALDKFSTIPSAGFKLRSTIAFCGLRLKSKMVNSNVPHLRSLVSVSCLEIIVQA